MSDRKKLNLEIEKKNQKKKKMYAGVAAVAALIAVAAVSFFIWNAQNSRWIVNFEGQRISTGDFRFQALLFDEPAQINEHTRQGLLDNLLRTLVILDRAELHGLGATAEELAGHEEIARNVRASMEAGSPGSLGFITDRRIAELLSANQEVAMRLMEHYVPEPPTDTEEFMRNREEFFEQNAMFVTDMQVKFVGSAFPDIIGSAGFSLDIGTPFDDVIREYSEFYDEEVGIEILDLWTFIGEQQLWDDADMLMALEVGETARVINSEMMRYFIVQMYSRDVDYEELEEAHLAQYIHEYRSEIFLELTQGWLDNADYRINRRVFDTIT